MTDAEGCHVDIVAAELRRIDRAAVADAVIDAERGGATSTETLCRLGDVLRRHRGLRRELSEPGRRAWDAVMADVHRAFPGSALWDWLARLVPAPKTR